MRYHLTLVRMAIINKSKNNKCWRGCEKREHSYTVAGNVNWKTECKYFRKWNIELSYDPAIPLLGIHPDKTFILKFTCWTIHVNLGWIPPGHAVQSFWYVVTFGCLKFCWEFLCLYSSKILADSFLFWWYLCLVLELGWWWHHRMSLRVFLLLQPFEKV